MSATESLRKALFEGPRAAWLRVPLFAALALVVWGLQSQGIQDAIVWIAFLCSLGLARERGRVWLRGAGAAFAVLLAFVVLTLPLGESPRASARDLVKILGDLAAVFAISVFFHKPGRIESALAYSAAAFTLILGCDLVRLHIELGPLLLREAHYYRPFVLNHSNVAGMAAGAAALVLGYLAWRHRDSPRRWIPCAAGIAVNLLYAFVIASRGPQIALAVTIGVAGLVLAPSARGRAVWAAAAVLGVVLLLRVAPLLNPRFADKVSLRGFSDRTVVWQHTWRLAQERPLLGYGFGKTVFSRVYYGSNPPEARFRFPHAHEYWLMQLFSHGWAGAALFAAAWGWLFVRLGRRVLAPDAGPDHARAALVLLLLFYLHVYGLADWPDHVLQLMMLWLIPAGLVVGAAPGAEAR